MLDQIATAFSNQDYKTVNKILEELIKINPTDPWVQLYLAKLDEINQKLELAEQNYLNILKNTQNPKILTEARAGIKRIADQIKQNKDSAIAEAISDPTASRVGILILEPIKPESRNDLAKKLAKIMGLDIHSAKLKLPTRGIRLYKTGKIGELKYYHNQLKQAEIPNFCTSLKEIENITILDVLYFESLNQQATIIYRNQAEQQGKLTFEYSQVNQIVVGLLPIFEKVFDFDRKNQIEHKIKTQDYAQFYDLHLINQKTILRICDSIYQFQSGIPFNQEINHPDPTIKPTKRRNWNALIDHLNQQFKHTPIWSDFHIFSPTVLDLPDLLSQIPSRIHLVRREETLWDPAFQLYSGIIFLKPR